MHHIGVFSTRIFEASHFDQRFIRKTDISASQQHFEERRFHLVLANPRPRGTAEPCGLPKPPAGRRIIQSLQVVPKVMGKKKHKRFIINVQKTYSNSHFLG